MLKTLICDVGIGPAKRLGFIFNHQSASVCLKYAKNITEKIKRT